MAILVTGGAGYIGSHTCVELLQEGYDVIVMDNFSNSNPESLKRVNEITGQHVKIYATDLLDKMGITRIFTENNIEAVIHLAGLKAVGESAEMPLDYYQNNVMGTITLCQVMKEHNVKKLVFSSSATVYGAIDEVPISEQTIRGAVNPYGRTKQMIEEILQDLHESDSEWSIALLRYFNPIGAHESGQIGEDPTGVPSNLLPYISQVAVGKMEYLNIYGSDYPTVDGTGVRDYIHVVDLAVGHIRALEKVKTACEVEAFNLGTGRGYSVLEVIKAFETTSKQSIPYKVIARRPGDVAVSYADASKAKDRLGWQATRGINEMCEDTWRWQQENRNGYKKELVTARES
ncbi:MAG TPA: UDP-glucose 4-epimerase GalE [Virgibacillus sp.]|nr:UDP-glucose 4-epimerase GalE [Virgibacillus sp.]